MKTDIVILTVIPISLSEVYLYYDYKLLYTETGRGLSVFPSVVNGVLPFRGEFITITNTMPVYWVES